MCRGFRLLSAIIFCGFLNVVRLDNEEIKDMKYKEALLLANNITTSFVMMFQNCVAGSMPKNDFKIDYPQHFVNFPSRTTVGFAPKFTSNRKFFANMLGTTAFKQMLENDVEDIRRSLVQKLKFCDKTIRDPAMMKEFYDKDVEQTIH